jgi:hypothetical protein
MTEIARPSQPSHEYELPPHAETPEFFRVLTGHPDLLYRLIQHDSLLLRSGYGPGMNKDQVLRWLDTTELNAGDVSSVSTQLFSLKGPDLSTQTEAFMLRSMLHLNHEKLEKDKGYFHDEEITKMTSHLESQGLNVVRLPADRVFRNQVLRITNGDTTVDVDFGEKPSPENEAEYEAIDFGGSNQSIIMRTVEHDETEPYHKAPTPLGTLEDFSKTFAEYAQILSEVVDGIYRKDGLTPPAIPILLPSAIRWVDNLSPELAEEVGLFNGPAWELEQKIHKAEGEIRQLLYNLGTPPFQEVPANTTDDLSDTDVFVDPMEGLDFDLEDDEDFTVNEAEVTTDNVTSGKSKWQKRIEKQREKEAVRDERLRQIGIAAQKDNDGPIYDVYGGLTVSDPFSAENILYRAVQELGYGVMVIKTEIPDEFQISYPKRDAVVMIESDDTKKKLELLLHKELQPYKRKKLLDFISEGKSSTILELATGFMPDVVFDREPGRKTGDIPQDQTVLERCFMRAEERHRELYPDLYDDYPLYKRKRSLAPMSVYEQLSKEGLEPLIDDEMVLLIKPAIQHILLRRPELRADAPPLEGEESIFGNF